tara:strand:+ start:17828 stop:18130 length:303 start_codon:yes stop_codon:yes gene_type:complete
VHKKSDTLLSPSEKKRALYYKKLRLKKKFDKRKQKKKVRLTNQQEIIITQHIQMECYKKRVSQKRCNQLLKKRPSPCIKILKKNNLVKLNKCLIKHLFNK